MFPVCAQRNVPQALARFAVPPPRGWRGFLAMLANHPRLLLASLLRRV